MIAILLRALVVAVMLAAPFILLAISQSKSGGLLWLLFPIVLLIPVTLASLLLFAPFEALVERTGLNANLWLPIFGGLLGTVVVVAALKTSKNPQVMTKLLAGDPSTVGAMAGIIVAGAAVGAAWRLSLWALKSFNWA